MYPGNVSKIQATLFKRRNNCLFRVQVNEGVREKENSDRLEWLQTHVACDGLEEQLIFNSLTNSLGPRKLLHFGILHKVLYAGRVRYSL